MDSSIITDLLYEDALSVDAIYAEFQKPEHAGALLSSIYSADAIRQFIKNALEAHVESIEKREREG